MENRTILFYGNSNGTSLQLENIFETEGYALQTNNTIEEFKEVIQSKPKAVIIDLDDFGDQVWSVCLELKEDVAAKNIALILLSSNDDENLRIKGLESGADDFITKPYSARELSARIKAIYRRIAIVDTKKIKVKDIEIDLDEHRVRKAGKPIDLTYIQFKLLYLLASRRNNVFSRKEILEKVWGKKVYVTNRTVDVHIKRLREKLGEYKYPSQYIETIHGTGYRFL